MKIRVEFEEGELVGNMQMTEVRDIAGDLWSAARVVDSCFASAIGGDEFRSAMIGHLAFSTDRPKYVGAYAAKMAVQAGCDPDHLVTLAAAFLDEAVKLRQADEIAAESVDSVE